MLIDLLLIVLIGALLELDRTSVLQGFLSEPIVTAPIVGWVTGDFMLGVKIGILLELFFLGGISIGGSSPLDGTLSAVVTSASAGTIKTMIESDSSSEGALIALAVVLLMIPASRVGRAVDDWIKEMNVNTAHQVDCAVREKGIRAVERTIYKGLGISFVLWALTTLVTTVAGTALLWGAVKIMPEWVSKGMEGVSKFLPFIAGGIALSALRIRRAQWWFAGMCVGLFLISMGLSGFAK
jgi:mannose/fructose/N-acetylgalactosamine-specific phosphotransferase system component IIC